MVQLEKSFWCVCLCGWTITFELNDLWLAFSSSHYLGQVMGQSSRLPWLTAFKLICICATSVLQFHVQAVRPYCGLQSTLCTLIRFMWHFDGMQFSSLVELTSFLIWCDTVGLVTGRALALLNLLIYPKGIIWEPVPIRSVVVIVMVVGSMETVQVTPLRRFIASSP